jgi:hypothetical protein
MFHRPPNLIVNLHLHAGWRAFGSLLLKYPRDRSRSGTGTARHGVGTDTTDRTAGRQRYATHGLPSPSVVENVALLLSVPQRR